MDREVITAAFDALDAGVDAVLGLDCEALSTQERLRRSTPSMPAWMPCWGWIVRR
ncbi:hypothetical protein H7H78_06070 [Mycobacterium shinjukuense]|uniref:hypothetical protein n=1 Tax=Mycobacterium shinjukuense TaxID=398694 RepID=UPI0021F29BFE|nr:hypothetical protein [Mycobacterium shinjukuense]MCV6985026.1 hypothetical protein [Mycobacterium shinjukuense]